MGRTPISEPCLFCLKLGPNPKFIYDFWDYNPKFPYNFWD